MSSAEGGTSRPCNNCQQISPAHNMVHCPGCYGWFHVHCLGTQENIFKPGWRCSSCSGPPVSESTTIASNSVTTTATSTSTSGSSVGSILSEQAKADLLWIANQRESILRDVERQQQELERKKEELERVSREASRGVINYVQRPTESSANNAVDWMQRMLDEFINVSISAPGPIPQSALDSARSSTPILTTAANMSQLNAGTFTVLNRPSILSIDVSQTQPEPTGGNASTGGIAARQSSLAPNTSNSVPTQGQSMQWPPQQKQSQQWSSQQEQTQGWPQQDVPQGVPQGGPPPVLPQGLPQHEVPMPHGGLPQGQLQELPPQLPPQELLGRPQGSPQSGLPQYWPQHGIPPGGVPQGQLQEMPRGGPPQGLLQELLQPGRLQGAPWAGPPQGWPQQGPPQFGLPQGLPQGWPPQGAPQGGPPGAPQEAPQGAPQGAPQRAPQEAPHGAPQGALQGAPQGWLPQGLPQGGPPHGNPVPYPPFQSRVGPTQQQLLARQVMPKDLPVFRGDPEDWPLFLSAYTNSTNACGYTDVENLARLQKAVQGKALEKVKNRLVFPACVPQVLSTLYMFYGRPEIIIQTLLDKLRETPAPKADRLETLINFGMVVQNLCDHIEASGQMAHLNNPVLLRELVEKLPTQQRLNWAFFKQQFVEVDIRAFAAYMSVLVAAASEVTVVTESKRRADRSSDKSYLNTHSASDQVPVKYNTGEERSKDEAREVVCLACNGPSHKVKDCISFKEWDTNARWEVVKENHLCRTCLGKHGRRPCNIHTRCGVEGCQERHHRLLHSATPTPTTSNPQTSPKENQKPSRDNDRQEDGLSAHHATKKSTLFRILPVTLTWKGKSVDTFAFLDDGSDLTLVEQAIAEQLGIDDGENIPLCLSWTSNVTRQEPNSQRICLKVSGKDKKEQFALSDARTVASLDLPKQTLRYADLARQHPYLRGLPVSSYEAASPGILIGSNNAGLIATLSLREGQLGEPLASKTRLGWAIYGCSADGRKPKNFTLHACECQSDCKTDQDLHELVKRYFTVESIGVSADKGPESEEDKRARSILQATTRRVSNKFETGLLWRHDDVKFPNSFPMAMRRMECFERKMEKDPELKASVQRQIKEYMDNNYIHEVTLEEMESTDPKKVWYLPLGAVRNLKKPGKIRLVWDAAAKVGNVSLNSMLLKGPDLLKPLASVVCGFRERPVAVCGDLKQMFHQFRIRQDDVQSQRFLYRDHPSEAVKTFVMDVGSFGATCSPCQAQYIKNLNATEHAAEFPEAAKAIVNKHYVDDYLDSFDSDAEAIKVALEVKEVHARGGFEIRNWHSNSNALLERVGEPKQEQTKAVSIDAESEAERVLGLLWLPEEDVLAFATQLQLDGIPPTKRNILRCVMSLFDSQGILSHITIQGRIIIQDTWRNKMKWDDEVIEAIRTRWLRWTKLFKKVGEIKLTRAYFPGFSAAEVGAVELHVFTDASEEAYACTAYFRVVINGKVYVTLAMAKAKVAPLKALSVPRLELMGALLGARLAKAVMDYHTFPICRRVFWTDSKTTLAWINSHHRRYRQFVAFRVGEILSKTDAVEWRYVPTLFNPADEATKWGKGPSTDVKSRWFRGPDFLYLPEADWPAQASLEPLETEEELRPCMLHKGKQAEDIFEINNFSEWESLQKTAAYVHRFVGNCIRKRQKQHLVTGWLKREELQRAENSLWRIAQESAYPDEITVLKQSNARPKKAIEKTSPVYKLTPFLDEDGVMRVDSRIGVVPYVSYDFKYPVILPRHHPLTNLVIDWYHRRYLHANHKTVHNEVRQRFHIAKLYTTILQVAKACQICKNNTVTPATPRMAPLPEARLAAMVRPFSFVGLDYFGPISVRVGRSCVKRWIALFTCLTVRAVHLEVVHSLTTESCKMAVRRFVARRGSPVEIHSDNGTNFQGASRELKEEIATIGQGLAGTFTNSNTKWIFIPPSAPHFGGSWERLVRSVKVALRSLCSDRNPDDETLLTVIAESESIVNSRPLTSVPLESADEEALTPNHFLLLSSSGVVQPSRELSEPMKATRTNWNLARQLVDRFWRRWICEYLPTIANRTKWFKETEAIKIDDQVLVVNEGERNGWTRGRVLSLIPGRDGRVRQVTVQTTKGVLRRPVSRLAVLDIRRESNAESPEEPEVRYGSGDVGESASTDGKDEVGHPSPDNCHTVPGRTEEKCQRRSDRLAKQALKGQH